MSNMAKINHLGFEILHYHAGRVIVFQAYRGSSPVRLRGEVGRQIRKPIIILDRDNPLSDEEKDWLIGGAK